MNTAHLTLQNLDTIREVAAANRGKCPLFLCLKRPGGDLIFIETHENFFVAPSRELQHVVDEQFGEETYYAKVDNSLPERTARKWESKSSEPNGE